MSNSKKSVKKNSKESKPKKYYEEEPEKTFKDKLKDFKINLKSKYVGLKLWLRKKRQMFVKKVILNKEFVALEKAILTMILDGLLISGLVFPFIGFDLKLAIAYGVGWYFLQNKGLKELRQLISSLNLVKVGR